HSRIELNSRSRTADSSLFVWGRLCVRRWRISTWRFFWLEMNSMCFEVSRHAAEATAQNTYHDQSIGQEGAVCNDRHRCRCECPLWGLSSLVRAQGNRILIP